MKEPVGPKEWLAEFDPCSCGECFPACPECAENNCTPDSCGPCQYCGAVNDKDHSTDCEFTKWKANQEPRTTSIFLESNDNPLLDFVEDGYAKARALMRDKNADYAGPVDPLKNFRMAEKIGLTTLDGIALRLLDKVARFSELHKKGGNHAVRDESLEDTILDICNYAQIYLYAVTKERP